MAAKKKAQYFTGRQGSRAIERKQFHILLSEAERAKLVKLTRSMQLNAADVVRTLIERAK